MSLVELSHPATNVALVRLNRPPVNALSEELSQDLAAAFAECADPEVRVVVVTGQPHFAAGADIKAFLVAHASSGGGEGIAASLVAAIAALEGLAKPTIAAVHGYALGGGLELAMGADFRYLADDAQVGQPEIKLGIIPGAGGTQRLPRIVGFQRAKELIYTGRQVGAEEALRIGLADKVAPAAELLDLALAGAAELAAGPTRGIAAAKRALNDGWGEPIERGLEIEAAAFADCFWSEDAAAGVQAFVDKRPPRFVGR